MRLTKSKWIKPFLKSIQFQIYLVAIILTIFALLIWLTRAPFYFFGYASQLTLFVFSLLLLFQWSHYKKRVDKVQLLNRTKQNSFEDELINSLDEAYEMQYKQLEKEFELFRDETRLKEKDQMDYFTLWLHQIKTPISVISLILQRSEDESKEKQQLEQELIYLNNYTHMALNYLKLEETGKELDLEEIKLDGVIKETLKSYSLLFIYNDISLEYDMSDEAVLTDRKWLQVLLEQILSNSLKYSPGGTIKIYMETPTRLTIEDTGSGIRKEDLPKIFEKGYTGLNGRLHEKSTGLGLFLSRKICHRLGHTLTIASEIGVGTKATIDFAREKLIFFD